MSVWEDFKKHWESKLQDTLTRLPDPDEVFSYDTVKQVRVLDRRLGYIYWGVLTLVMVYVVVGACFIEKQYLVKEKTQGWIICKVMGLQFSQFQQAWDVYERVHNPGEMGATFIPTRILITRGQVESDGVFCESRMHNCTLPQDCDIGNLELQKQECVNGHCMRRQWCPEENVVMPTTETHYLELDSVELWFQSFVHFHDMNLDVSTADEAKPTHYPAKLANTYALSDLVRMANIDEEEFLENGAIMFINFFFQCDFDALTCEIKVEPQNVDSQLGYNYVQNHYYFEDGVRKRDSYRMYGIRVFPFATGFGTVISGSAIMLQLSSAIALTILAETVADFWLMHMVPERRHYTNQKVMQAEVNSAAV